MRNISTENRQENRKPSGIDSDPYAIKSWLAMSMGLKGFKTLIRLDGHVVGGGYNIGARKIPKVRITPRALPTSRRTRLMIESRRPRPSANSIAGTKIKGTKIARQ